MNTIEKNKVLLLLSGGLDSTTLLAELSEKKKKIFALSFNYGQKHSVELDFARRNAQKYKVEEHWVIDIPELLFRSSALVNPHKKIEQFKHELPKGEVSTYVPSRNLLFASYACSIAESHGIKQIYFAFNQDDTANYWDTSHSFLQQLNKLVSKVDIKVLAPYSKYPKTDVVQLARQLNINIEDTISCYQPINNKSCKRCLSCKIRETALG